MSSTDTLRARTLGVLLAQTAHTDFDTAVLLVAQMKSRVQSLRTCWPTGAKKGLSTNASTIAAVLSDWREGGRHMLYLALFAESGMLHTAGTLLFALSLLRCEADGGSHTAGAR